MTSIAALPQPYIFVYWPALGRGRVPALSLCMHPGMRGPGTGGGLMEAPRTWRKTELRCKKSAAAAVASLASSRAAPTASLGITASSASRLCTAGAAPPPPGQRGAHALASAT